MDKKEKEQAFTRMVKAHKSLIYSVCYMFSKDENEVADLFQESLIRLWGGYDSFGGRSAVRTWIYRVCLNTCISLDRKRRKRNVLPLSMDINLFAPDDDDTRQIDLLRRRIQRLGPFDRALVLLWLEDMSYDEIGQIIGISAKNVSVKLVRIKEKLKQMSNQ